jgi:hypothetical protein
MDEAYTTHLTRQSRRWVLWIFACGCLLPFSAHAVQLSSDMSVALGGTDLLTGATSQSVDGARSGAATAVLSLGFPFDTPAAASGLSREDGIVRGSIHTGIEPYSATLRNTWVADFSKDSADATFEFNITNAVLSLGDFGGFTSGDLSARFDFTVFLGPDTPFQQTAEIAGLGGTTLDETFHVVENSGPMAGFYTETGFGDNIHEATLLFDPFAGSVDLSGIPVGDTFSVIYELIMEARGIGGETYATARFSDPAEFGGGGISTTISGLTPIIGAVPVPPALLLFGSGLLGLLGVARKKAS